MSGTLAVANGGTGVTTSTGSGSVVLSNSPTLVTPALGTPSSATSTNATGLPLTTWRYGMLSIAMVVQTLQRHREQERLLVPPPLVRIQILPALR
jgi:hypothetical protein